MRQAQSVAANPAQNIDFIIQSPECVQDFFKISLGQFGGYKPNRAAKIVFHLMAHIQFGKLDIILPNNKTLRFAGDKKGPHGILRVHRDRVFKRFLTGGQLAFCEAYLDGDWSSPDIASFFELIIRNSQAMKEKLLGKKWTRVISWLSHIMQPNSKRGSKKNIYRHYDIGNTFYEAWLDPSMTYSSALFADGITDLEKAQERKYEEMVRRLDLKPEHHVLEIGCGWGGFAEYAARTVGCKVTGITISEAQHQYATKRIQNAGLSNKVEIRLEDYRDVKGSYDRIASIEMFEAVGQAYWPAYFGTLKNRLKPGGHAVLQIITIRNEDFDNYSKGADYIQRYIFPGGMLPSMQKLEEQITLAGLEKGDHLSFGKDYAHTLNLWNADFQRAWPDLNSSILDTRFKRLWEQYLCYCEAGFNTGSIDVIQLAVHKP